MRSIVVPISRATAEEEIQQFLDRMVESWNRGDLDEFVAGYAEDARMMSTSGFTSGMDILVAYRNRYPSASEMGKLSLEVEEIKVITHMGQHLMAWVWVKWFLGSQSGNSLLVLRRLPSWEIVAEATA